MKKIHKLRGKEKKNVINLGGGKKTDIFCAKCKERKISGETIPNKHETEQSKPLIKKNLESNFLLVPIHTIQPSPGADLYTHRENKLIRKRKKNYA